MKLWTIAGIVTGLFFLTLAGKKETARTAVTRIPNDPDTRYDVDDLIIDQPL